jgi:hypothetical protein
MVSRTINCIKEKIVDDICFFLLTILPALIIVRNNSVTSISNKQLTQFWKNTNESIQNILYFSSLVIPLFSKSRLLIHSSLYFEGLPLISYHAVYESTSNQKNLLRKLKLCRAYLIIPILKTLKKINIFWKWEHQLNVSSVGINSVTKY